MQAETPSDTSSQEPSQLLLLTIEQAAKSLNISRALFYTLLAKNEGPPVIRLGRSVRISVDSLRRWVEEQESMQQVK